MIRRTILLGAAAMLAALALAAPAGAAEPPPCELAEKAKCFGVESVEAALSSTQAGAHPDLTFSFDIKQNPETKLNSHGFHDAYAPTRNVRVELPPGLVGDPNVLGVSQQCTAAELSAEECPNGSQIGVSEVSTHDNGTFIEPIYMMQPPGGDVVARIGFIAAIIPIYVDATVRSESDYGINFEISNAPEIAFLLRAKTTTWGVPGAKAHDTERCTPSEVFLLGCTKSPEHPPGVRPLPFITNPTRCGVPLEMRVNASSWVEPKLDPAKAVSASFPEITGCDKLPFGPGLTLEPTSHRAGAPTGLEMTIKLPASEGVEVLEPAQTRSIKITLPKGLALNPGAADGLGVCSAAQVHFEENLASQCPDAAKLADTEFDVPVLERNLRGAIYIREPEPGNPYRVWIVADDLGLHIKLPAQLNVDKATGQIESIVIGTPRTEGIPQAPLREVKLSFKSGLRAPLVNPQSCGTYTTEYEFVPWSGGPAKTGTTAMKIDEGCNTGGFAPKLSAGTTDPTGGAHSPFVFTLTREDGEQSPQGLDIALPKGLAATFAGVSRCEGAAAQSGQCPPGSRIGRVSAAIGAGPNPFWAPQPGKRPTAVYLGGPYKGAPTSIVAVVPKQAGPFDFGDEVVRSAIYIDPITARATAVADPLPQLIEGIPISYRTLNVELDRSNFTLNPTSCAPKATETTVTSAQGAIAHPSSPFTATNCARLAYKPSLSLKLKGGTKRGQFPALGASFRPRPGDANPSSIVVRLPHSAFLEQGHFRTICTRVQYAAGGGHGAGCPAASAYGHVTASSPLLEGALEGPVYLRSSSHNLPDMVLSLHGPPSLPIAIEAVGRIDSAKGGIRSSFEAIPDAPLTEVRLEMEGGKKGLIVNSTNLCASTNRAKARLTGQNGKVDKIKPVLRAECGKRGKKKHRRHVRHERNKGKKHQHRAKRGSVRP